MKSLTIYADDENLALIQALAEKMGLTTESQPRQTNNGEAMAQALEELAQQNTLADIIPDPVAWQRNVRQDRVLPYRD